MILKSTGSSFMPGAQLPILQDVDFGGEPGQPPPTIIGGGSEGIRIFSGATNATVHDVRISQASGNVALEAEAGTTERVFATSNGANEACASSTGATIRNTVCWDQGGGVGLSADVNGSTTTVTLVNVTAVAKGAGGTGIQVGGFASGGITLNATNVIARGPMRDVSATRTGTATATANLANSDYATAPAPGPGVTVTPAGTNGNLTLAPLFANAPAGDFHELAGSPTIDSGAVFGGLSALDLDRTARSQPLCLGGAIGKPDIGAYEIAPPVPSPTCSAFTIGQLKLNKKKGSATLSFNVPGAGRLSATGKGLKATSADATAAGNITLTLKASGKAKKKLKAKGKAKLTLALNWAPTGNTAATQTDKVKLKKKKKK